MLFTSCSEEETEEIQETANLGGIQIDAEQSFKVLKGVVIRSYGTVNIPEPDFKNLIEHSTIKIRSLDWSVAQEWLYIDMKSSLWYYYSTQSGDTSGDDHGIYYRWCNNFDDMTQSDWDDLVYDENWNELEGFHIPTDTDITNLASVVGSTSSIRSILQLEYDGTKNSYPEFSTEYAAMWVDLSGTGYEPNIVDGCGVLGKWVADESDNLYYCFTNIPNLGVNVRLVRDITSSEW